ncbi:disulfide bond formation protein B [Halotalea alkalilenta]|uniref:Disulfide bond formation protein B n=1 Tax=Halotalea alkalilenta TaxID=376489 RepID=A0A172YI35_9GAMM|nr:disulfide bond formation protein B [Halotalea alkalilenta]ANF58900.1 dihydrolipoamide acetyltransferase [Halotalea alkalilenta]
MIDKLSRIICRGWCLLGVLICILMMAVALLLEHLWGLEPCPLCIFQRIAVIATFLVLLPGIFHNPKGKAGAVYGVGALITSGAGIALAGRHLWLQSLPPDAVPSCGPGLDYMLEVLPFWGVISQVLSGSGECAEIHGIWLGITLPGWTMMGFAVLALISIALILSSLRRGRRGPSKRLL